MDPAQRMECLQACNSLLDWIEQDDPSQERRDRLDMLLRMRDEIERDNPADGRQP